MKNYDLYSSNNCELLCFFCFQARWSTSWDWSTTDSAKPLSLTSWLKSFLEQLPWSSLELSITSEFSSNITGMFVSLATTNFCSGTCWNLVLLLLADFRVHFLWLFMGPFIDCSILWNSWTGGYVCSVIRVIFKMFPVTQLLMNDENTENLACFVLSVVDLPLLLAVVSYYWAK